MFRPQFFLGKITLVKLALIFACGTPDLARAQGEQTSPWSIQHITNSLLQKTQASATPLLSNQPGWQAAAPYPTNIAYYGSAQNGDDLYIIAGLPLNSNYPADHVPLTAVRRYNVVTDNWTSLADLPRGSVSPACVYYEGKIYVLDSEYEEGQPFYMRIYDVATNTWSVGAPRPPAYPGEGYRTYRGAAAGAFNGNIYIAGSWERLSIYNIDTDAWTEGPQPQGGGSSSAQIGQYLYVFGGIRAGGFAGIFNSDFCFRFDMASNTWSSGPKWTFRRHSFALAAIGNKLFALGGDEDGGYDNPGLGVAELDTSSWPDGAWLRSPYKLPSERMYYRAGFASAGRSGGEIWSTGGDLSFTFYPAGRIATNEHLFLPVSVTSGGSSIVSSGADGMVDPGETITVQLGVVKTEGTGPCTPRPLTGTLHISGGVTNPSGPQNYGLVCLGNPVFHDFSFMVDPTLPCGAEVIATLELSDGKNNYGTFPYRFYVGRFALIFAENFDSVIAPALPPGWLTSYGDPPWSQSPPLWRTSTAVPDTGTNEVVAEDSSVSADRRLDSPPIFINSSSALVRFRHIYMFNAFEETPLTYDYGLNEGGVLEISSPNINGGAFTDITDSAVGGSFITGGYDALIGGCCGALSGREAWGRTSAGYVTAIARLGPKVAGQFIRLRFRANTGIDGGSWRIDTLSVGTPICETDAPQVASAVSRKTHGSSGPFDIELPLVELNGPIGIENRTGAIAGEHQIAVTFANPVTIGFASVIAGVGSVASTTVSGEEVTINLSGIANAQRVSVALGEVSDGIKVGNVLIPIGILAGDTNASGVVNSDDVNQTKSRSGSAITTFNFRNDVTASGAINATDIAAVKSKLGTALP
jgi:hypothetical protein